MTGIREMQLNSPYYVRFPWKQVFITRPGLGLLVFWEDMRVTLQLKINHDSALLFRTNIIIVEEVSKTYKRQLPDSAILCILIYIQALVNKVGLGSELTYIHSFHYVVAYAQS